MTFEEWDAQFHCRKILGSPESIGFDNTMRDNRKEGWGAAIKYGTQPTPNNNASHAIAPRCQCGGEVEGQGQCKECGTILSWD